MARHSSLFFFFFLALFVQHLHAVVSLPTLPRRSLEPAAEQWQPMQCAPQSLIPSCNSYLYVTPQGRSLSEIASDFKGNASLIQPIKRLSGSEDLLIPVPCMCEAINATVNALFHDTGYEAIQNDISSMRVFLHGTRGGVVIHGPAGRYPEQHRNTVQFRLQGDPKLESGGQKS